MNGIVQFVKFQSQLLLILWIIFLLETTSSQRQSFLTSKGSWRIRQQMHSVWNSVRWIGLLPAACSGKYWKISVKKVTIRKVMNLLRISFWICCSPLAWIFDCWRQLLQCKSSKNVLYTTLVSHSLMNTVKDQITVGETKSVPEMSECNVSENIQQHT